MQTTRTLRRLKCYRDGKDCWICEIDGEEELWAFAKTPEEAIAELLALLEEREREQEEEGEDDEEEEEDYRPVGFSLDPGIPGPFGIHWRWVLLPAILLTFLFVSCVVRSESVHQVQVTPPVPSYWTAPAPTWNQPYRDLERELELERRLWDLERRQAICSDPDLPLYARNTFCR